MQRKKFVVSVGCAYGRLYHLNKNEKKVAKNMKN